MNRRFNRSSPASLFHSRRHRIPKFVVQIGLCLLCSVVFSSITLAQAQTSSPANEAAPVPSPALGPGGASPAPPGIVLPDVLPDAPVVKAPPSGQYVLEFNRSPVVGNRLRLEGIYDETRLQFTRPRSWQPKSVKIQLRFRHSAALYASRSNITVLINGTSIGSVPLNKPLDQVGNVVFNVPTGLIQDYNEVVIGALQNNSPTCTQDPFDPSLWTEILPDSKLVFDFQPQPIPLDFNRYPYPIFDTLSLEPNQLAYLLPKTLNEAWLTATTRFQTALGRVAEYRPLKTRLVKSLEDVKTGEQLVVIGTPATQSALTSLDLPLPIQDQKILDGKQKPLPPDVGVLMLTTAKGDRTPVLVATGNSPEAVAKAVQFLVQGGDRRIGTGQVVLVDELNNVPSPPPREWRGYLPLENNFQLRNLTALNRQPIGDVTVRGSNSPALQFDFRALPDDQFSPGNSMILRYSYGPQVNPLTSLVEVQLDGVTLAGNRLTSVDGAHQQSLRVNLPEEQIKPDSRMQVNFRLDPRERRSCSRVTDQQLWGTIHANSDFHLNRENIVRVPDLKLLRSGYPFTAPQDLSNTAIVLPKTPSTKDVLLLLEVGERLGRLSQADSVKLEVYRADHLPSKQRSDRQLIAIGTQARFPLPEVFKTGGFSLQNLFSRYWQHSRIQTLPDAEGVVKQVMSPWNGDRMLLALTGQTDAGLDEVRALLSQDALFFQMQGDTVLVSANEPTPSLDDPNAYSLEFLQENPQRELSSANWTTRLLWLLRDNWFVLAPATVVAALVLYGVTQLYLKRLTGQEQ